MPPSPNSASGIPVLSEAMAFAITEIGGPGFPQALLAFIGEICTFDSSLIVLYSRRRRPDVLLDNLSHALRENTAEHYIGGAYLLDPFYIRARGAGEPQMLRMQDIAPRDFDTSEYFVSYYKRSNVIDELNYLVPLDDGRVFAVCFERSTIYDPFSETEIEALAAFLPVVAALVGQHVSMPGVMLPANATDTEHDRLESILRSFGSNVLTPRECEIVHLMLNGYSASAIAGLLGVSVETVRVHRRNIYDKLGISSLAELFSMALKAIYTLKFA